MNNLIYGKRFIARILDLVLPTIISLFGLFLYANSQNQSLKELDTGFVQIVILIFYTIFILFSIIQLKNKTYGDLVMKINLVSLNKNVLKLSSIFSREIYIAIIILVALEYGYGWLALVISFMPMGKSKEKQIPIIATDIIYKSTYIESKISQD